MIVAYLDNKCLSFLLCRINVRMALYTTSQCKV